MVSIMDIANGQVGGRDYMSVLNDYPDCVYEKCPKNVFNIYIEGCIGSGKTTLTQRLRDYLVNLGYRVIYCEENINPDLLSEFYKSPEKIETVFQIGMEINRVTQKIVAHRKVLDMLKQDSESPIFIISDTGFMSSYAFTIANYLNQSITNKKYTEIMIMVKYLNRSIEGLQYLPTHIILLNRDIDFCAENIAKRGRASEKGIMITYLLHLISSYNDIFAHMLKMSTYSDVTFYKTELKKSYIDPENIIEIVGFKTESDQIVDRKRKKAI